MTPAINAAKKANVSFKIHEYEHDPKAESYGEEAADKLGVDVGRVYKTLIAQVDGKSLAVSVVPVSNQLDLKSFASSLGAKKSAMADQKAAERSTGYVVGGISPLGQRKPLKTVVDASAQAHDTIFVSAGKRGLEIEIAPGDLAKLTNAIFYTIAR